MKKQYNWFVWSGCLAVTVGCTVPFLVNNPNVTPTSQPVASTPDAVSSALPIFLPQGPGSNVLLPSGTSPSVTSGFGPVSSPNPTLSGPLPSPTATPFIPNIIPDIANPIAPAAIPSVQASGALAQQAPIIRGIYSGRVWGFDMATETFKPIADAKVKVGDSLTLSSDRNGFYQTSQEFQERLTISAAKSNYIASTVTGVPPGVGRDIHLYPINNAIPYRQDFHTFSGSVHNLAQNGKDAIVVFADNQNSSAPETMVDRKTGNFNMSVRLRTNKSSTTGTLFGYVPEQTGNLSQVSQFSYSPNVVVPTIPPQPVPTPSPATTSTDTSIKPSFNQLLLAFDHLVSPQNFGKLSLKLLTPSTGQLVGVVAHIYMNLPDGSRVLIARYTDPGAVSINQVFRVPKIANTTFSLEAHSGTATRGSDIVVPNIPIESEVVRTFLAPPTYNRLGDETNFTTTGKTHFTTSSITPRIGWQTLSEANSYQLDIQGDNPLAFRWEAYSLDNSVAYPDFGTDQPGSLRAGRTYQAQLMANDFDLGSFNVLSASTGSANWKRPPRIQRILDRQSQGGFSVQLFTPSIKNFPQGYRVSYNTLTFTIN